MRMRNHVAVGLALVGLMGVLVLLLHAAMIEESKVVMPDPTMLDTFGQAVAIGTDVAIVGAAGHDTPFSNAGAAYVIDLATGTSTHKLSPTGVASGDSFGGSVGVSGDVAIVGAIGADTGGAAYLFSAASGGQLHKLSPSDPASGDMFGLSLGIDGNVAVVGAPNNDGPNNSGSAYVFNVTTGTESRKLLAGDAASGDAFGWAVAVSGNVAIVGAKSDDNAVGYNAGAAYLIDVISGDERHKLMASDGSALDEFGTAVAIGGGVAIVGAPKQNGSAGAAYLFDVATGGLLFKLTADDAAGMDYFGSAVAICGNAAIVGAYGNDDAGSGSGSAYIFDVTTGEQFDKVLASDAASGDSFGYSVGVSWAYGIAGAKDDEPPGVNTGSAYIFAVPEPATVALVVLGALGVMMRRRRTT